MKALKYPVLKTFRDKFTKVVHEAGSPYETDDADRVKELQDLGFIGATVGVSDSEDGLKSLGGGVYELPNGNKVRGKEKALESLRSLKGGDADESSKAE